MKKTSLKYFQAARTYALAHKAITIAAAIVIIGGGYWAIRSLTAGATTTRYVTATVAKGTLISSVTGSGQISAYNQVDIKPKASGDITYIAVKEGQPVKAGQLIAQIDATDAQKAVRDAEISLESAELSLQKLTAPADALSITQSQNNLAKAQESKENSESDLKQAYDSGFNTTANAFLDLPGIMSGLQSILYSSDPKLAGNGQQNISYYSDAISQRNSQGSAFAADAEAKYQTARTAYDKNFAEYKAASRFSDTATVDALITESYTTTKTIAEAIKSVTNLIQLYKDTLSQASIALSPAADTQLASLTSFTSKTNADISNLLSAQTAIKNDKDAIVNAGRTIAESTESYAKLQAGADTLDVQTNQLSLKQRQNTLADARANLADSSIRAPFAGTVAKLTAKKGDSTSSGSSIGTLITAEKVAVISFNEVDIARVKAGQKATITFDAIEGLTIAGEVESVDTLGTVSQGVVTYDVTIRLTSDDARIKTGMSISVSIMTDVVQDALIVPSSAIKSAGNSSTVQVFDTPLAGGESAQGAESPVAPRTVPVQVGLSNDTSAEITSGLKDGDIVVVRTITATAAKASTAASATSLLGGTRTQGAAAGGATRTFGGGR